MRSLSQPFIAAGLALFALPCFAITKAPPVLKNIGGNVWEAVHDAGNTVSTTRTWSTGTEIGSAKVTDAFTWVYRERSKIPITATSTVSAAAVGRIAAKLLPIIGTASLAYDVWQQIGCKFENGQIKCDPGAEPTISETEVVFWTEGGQEFTDRDAACRYKHRGLDPSLGYEISAGRLLTPTMSACRSQYGEGGWGYIYGSLRTSPGVSCGEGQLRFDGKCTTDNYIPKSEDEAGDHYGKNAPKVPGGAAKAPQVVQEGVGAGVPVPSSPPQVSGPPSVSSPGPSTTTTTPGGTTTTSNTTNVVNLTYNGSQIIVNETTTMSNSDGTITETTDQPFPEWLCGVLGMPDCNVKVNETGTPEWEQPDNSRLDDIKAADAAKMDEVAQTIPDPDLGWFDAPPLAACRPYPLPNDMGEIDACDVVDSVRAVMAYLWALVAAWMAFGWIRQAVNGG